MLERLDEQTTPVRFLLLNFEAVGFIDITGTDELRVLMDELKLQEVRLAFLSVRLPVKQVFESSGLLEQLNTEYMFERRETAIANLFQDIDHEYCKKECPYELFHECSTVK